MNRRTVLPAFASVILFSCAPPQLPPRGGATGDGGSITDAGSTGDGGSIADAGAITDAGAIADAGSGGCASNADCDSASYCAGSGCDSSGTCQTRPQVCSYLLMPVCGCDGETYGNECEANKAGVRVASDGACGSSGGGDGGTGGIACGDAGTCAPGEECFDVVVCGGPVRPGDGGCPGRFECAAVPACDSNPTCACFTSQPSSPCDGHRDCSVESDGVVRCILLAP